MKRLLLALFTVVTVTSVQAVNIYEPYEGEPGHLSAGGYEEQQQRGRARSGALKQRGHGVPTIQKGNLGYTQGSSTSEWVY